jgi:hypothetical protein
MPITAPTPFVDALAHHVRRVPLPTNLGSAELRALGSSFHRRSLVSARTTLVELLDQYSDDIRSILNPEVQQRADRITEQNPEGNVTVGMTQAEARLRAKLKLSEEGYQPEPGEAGTLKDLSSDPRINLVIKTNRELAQGTGQKIQGNDPAVLEAFPCWELKRVAHSKNERDWGARWVIAANDSGDTDALRVFQETGRMVARKDSPIWSSLGSSRLFDDALDTDFTPLAFGSNMWMFNVAYADAEELGLVNLTTKVMPVEIDFANVFNTEVAA